MTGSTGGPGRGWRSWGLRVRLALLLSGSVLLTLILAGFLLARTVFEPFARDVARSHLVQLAFLGSEVERGSDIKRLARKLGLELKRVNRTPPFVRRALAGRTHRCRPHHLESRRIVVCRGQRRALAVELKDGWLIARRVIDPDAPREQLTYVLLAVGGIVVVFSLVLTAWLTRPLRTSMDALEKMASGHLEHRLPETSSGELGEVARAFNHMADRVQSLLQAERTLMASISHELRTPLTRLRLHLELLRDAEPDPSAKTPSSLNKRLDAMEEDLLDMDRLIGEVLESSRLSIGERALVKAPIDLRTIVEEALGQVDVDQHEVRIEGAGGRIQGDGQRLVRVVRNLLENAAKYAPADTTVEIGLGPTWLEVRDQGPGVPESELPRLFEPFYRVAGATTAQKSGYGLGLMIARQIVELHEGSIAVSNRKPEPGLVVRIEMPSSAILETGPSSEDPRGRLTLDGSP